MGLLPILLLSLASQSMVPLGALDPRLTPPCACAPTVPGDSAAESRMTVATDLDASVGEAPLALEVGGAAGLGLDPAASLMAAGEGALGVGDTGAAVELLARACKLAPGEAELARLYARALAVDGHTEDALGAVRARGVSAWTAHERARLLYGLDRPAEAEAALREALASYPTFGRARLLLVRLLVAEGPEGATEPVRAAEAVAMLERLELQSPGEPEVALLSARLARRSGDNAQVVAILREALDRPRALARADMPESGSPGAAPLGAPAERALRLALADALAMAEQPMEAWLTAEPLLDANPSADDLVCLARLAVDAGEDLEALATLGAALVVEPTHPDALLDLGLLLRRGDELTTALATRHLASDPNDVRGWLTVLEAERAGGRDLAALARLESAPMEVRLDPRLRLFEAGALRRCSRYPEAAVLLVALLPDPAAAYELGLVEFARGSFDEACAAFATAATAGAEAVDLIADAHYGRALGLERLGRYAEAADELDTAVAVRDKFLEAWLQLGLLARYRLGDSPRARGALARYFELGGDDPELRRWLEARP